MLSVQQINTREINDNTKNLATVKETGKNQKTKLNHHQDNRNPLSNSFEIFPIEKYQDKPEPTDEENSMSTSFDHGPSKRRHKKPSINYNKKPEAYITNEQYEETLKQRKALIIPGRRTYSEAVKSGKKICVIGDNHLNSAKRNISQKSINRGNIL